MKLNDIVARASQAYPENWVLRFWDAERECPVENPDGGDTLALFIARELYETYESESTDSQQLERAIRKMRQAARELDAVTRALEGLRTETAP